jgi:hypothetical protein
MTKDEKIEKLKFAFETTIWMAIRYAHGRHTYAPSDVRDAFNVFKEVFPDFKMKEDKVIKENPHEGIGFKSDYLNDLFL